MVATNDKWGFLRESQPKADKVGADKECGLLRTGLDAYLNVIFPGEKWEYDKKVEGVDGRIRPDYRCEHLKLIVEFDGLPHYQYPSVILNDYEKDVKYKVRGYTVVRIPYFIQLTNEAVMQLFGKEVKETLFELKHASLTLHSRTAPACLCPLGIKRMAFDFMKCPDQYKYNIDALNEESKTTKYGFLLSRVDLLEKEYQYLMENPGIDYYTYITQI